MNTLKKAAEAFVSLTKANPVLKFSLKSESLCGLPTHELKQLSKGSNKLPNLPYPVLRDIFTSTYL